MRKLLFLVILIVLIAVVFLNVLKVNEKQVSSEEQSIDKAVEKLEELSFDQKVGQLFMIGFEGKEITKEIEIMMRELHPGAILLLGRNIENEEQLKGLINSLQKIAIEDTGLPLLIAVDQEGGEVSRIGWVEKIPQSEIKTKEHAYSVGKQRAEELKELGVNLNLAPLLDMLSENDFIFNRGFSENHNILGRKMVEGQRDGGILSCIKHFPGYGGIVFHPENELAFVGEVPEFSQFKNINSEMIMVSNVVYLELDKNLPFSFSKEGISLLKKEIGENQIIVSDDLSQYSLLNNFSLEDIVSKPFSAGVDILIFSGWRSSVKEAINKFKKIAPDNIERLNNSVLKIIELKQSISLDITSI